MSDGSSRAGNLLRIYKSLIAILGPYVYVGPKAAVVMCYLPNVNIFVILKSCNPLANEIYLN